MTTSGDGSDAPGERPAQPPANVIRPLAPTPPPGSEPVAAPGAPPEGGRPNVIRPLPGAPTGPPASPEPPVQPPAAESTPGQVIRRLAADAREPEEGGRSGRIIRPLAPLPPQMPGSRDRKTGIIRPLPPLPPLPGSSPEEMRSRRVQRDARLAAILRPLETGQGPRRGARKERPSLIRPLAPLPSQPAVEALPSPDLRTLPLPGLAEAPVLEWVYCSQCEAPNRPPMMFCLTCGGALPAASRLYDTLTHEYETMQSAQRPKPEIIPLLPSGRRGPNWQAFGLSDKGKVRQNNEDSLLAAPLPANGWLLLVADGMGGAEAGEVASQQAAEIVRELVENRMSLDPSPDTDHRPWLMQAIEQANHLLYRQAAEDPRLHGMGTTLTAGIVQGLCLELGHAGDSRCYRLATDRPLEQLTLDHAIVAHLLRLGQITPDEAYDHPLRNQLYRAVATAATIEVDTTLHVLAPTDKLLFCSDGLPLHVDDAEIEEVLRQSPTPQVACRALVDRTLARGAGDNVSVIVLMAR